MEVKTIVKTEKIFRIALVGCGRISNNHLESIQALKEGFKLTAVCDIEKDKAKLAGEKYKTPWFTDYRKMLDECDADVISICTPSGMHPEQGILAVERGCHVVVEKPIGISLEPVNQLINKCDKKNVHLFVVKQNRLNTTMQLLKRAVKKERFGKIYLAQSNVFWTRPQEYYDQSKWRGTWEFDGGAFMNQASHYVDALLWLIGPVDSVMAQTATMERDIETEDTGMAILKFRAGVLGSLNITMLTYPKNFEGSITILGERGTVKIGGTAINRVEKWEFDSYDDDDKVISSSSYDPPNVYGYGHFPYYQNVLSTLRGEVEPDTDGRSGRRTLELIHAIYMSAKDGVRISLPLSL